MRKAAGHDRRSYEPTRTQVRTLLFHVAEQPEARVQDLIPCVIGPWHHLPSVHVGPEQSEEAGQGIRAGRGGPRFWAAIISYDGGFMVD